MTELMTSELDELFVLILSEKNRGCPDPDVMLIANLEGLVIEQLAPGKVAREFLRELDNASSQTATAFQAICVLRELGF